VRWALRHHTAVFPHHQHLWRALRGWRGLASLLAPPRGASSLAASPPASRSPTGRLSGRACPRPWEGAWGTSTCGVAAAAPCCGPVATAVSHDGSPVATAPAAVRGALAERHLVVVGAPDLSALADARAGTIGVTLRTIEEE
jgi:hypothetical protein